MATKYLTVTETAKLVRAALKESFPGVKFSVRSDKYSGGASIRARWTDGPNQKQVESVISCFAGSYFDGSIDYKGSVYHMIDGVSVRMGADFIFAERDYSDHLIDRAISRVFLKYRLEETCGVKRPSAQEFRSGALRRTHFPRTNASPEELIHDAAYKISDRLKIEKSNTVGRIMVIGDDGYSRQCGSGVSAVPSVD